MAIWDEATEDLISELKGLPYIRVNNPDGSMLTNSILEAHRINSEYILKFNTKPTEFHRRIQEEIGYEKDKPVNNRRLVKTVLKYDPNSVLHGSFLEEIGGRLRIMRAISGFVEASNVSTAESGGVKNNHVQPELKGGEGNVPFPRTEFTAEKITAYFNLDLALLRGYGLSEEATNFLISLALFKVRRFFNEGLRLRTACDLDVIDSIIVTRPNGFTIPSDVELLSEAKSLLQKCIDNGLFAKPSTTVVQIEGAK